MQTGKKLNLIIYPSDLVGAGRVGKIANSLQQSGLFAETHAIGMRSADENLPNFEVLHPEVKINRFSVDAFNGPGGWTLGQWLWPRRVLKAYKNRDVGVVSAQRVRVLPLAYKLSKATGALLAYNAHELETEVLGFSGIKQKIAKYIERKYIYKVDIISVVNESIADWYENEYPGITKPVVLTNTPIDDGKSINLKEKLGIPKNELLYIHVGYISEGRNVPLILKEFAKKPHLHVVFLGDGSLRSAVEEAANKHPNIHWHPMVDPDTVVSYTRGADAGLCIIEYASLSDELSTPNKLLECWVAGIPPLSSGLQEAKRLIGEEASQKWVLENPEKQLAGALDTISSADIETFKQKWQPVPTWDSQVTSLVNTYKNKLNK